MQTDYKHIADLPRWEQELKRKHDQQMDTHQMRYGVLGKLQTKKQKQSLRRALEGRGVPVDA